MRLSKKDIEKALSDGDIEIKPVVEGAIGNASVDVHLGRYFKKFNVSGLPSINIQEPMEPYVEDIELNAEHRIFWLGPKEFVLGVTEEFLRVGKKHAGKIDGISSLARNGICVHITASNLNPGDGLHMTLEIYNFLERPIPLFHGMPVAQMEYYELKTPVDQDHEGYYSGDQKPNVSQYYRKFQDGGNNWIKSIEDRYGYNPITHERVK